MHYAMLILTVFCLVAADSEPAAPAKSDKELLQGKWKVVACQAEGKKSKLTDEELQLVKLIVKDDHYVVELPPGDLFGSKVVTRQEFKFALDESKKPKAIDITMLDEKEGNKNGLGIYSLEGGRLRICICEDGKTRPTDFVTKPKSDCVLVVYERDQN